MKQALLFPGQGSQTVGMGKDLYEAFAEVRDVFDQTDDALNFNLSKLIFDGDIEELTLTQNAQPALMALSVAIWRVLENKAGKKLSDFSYVAGHSLGQYSALCVAEAISLPDTARLLRARGLAMAEACENTKGTMAAVIGLERHTLAPIVQQANAFIANDNATGQIVISGTEQAVKDACELSVKAGAKRALPLNVAGAFHCPLMQQAQEKMKSIIAECAIKDAKVPVISNVMATPVVQAQDIKHDLILQITGQVEWTQTQHYLKNAGVGVALELGAGNVLAGLMRRTEPDITVYTINNVASLEAYLNKE